MFCAKCGKEIDDDSTFCPYCGQETDAPVENHGGIQKPKVSVKMPNKKVLGGIAVAVVAVLLVFGISKLIGGISNRSKSPSERLFAMSWEDVHELSENELRDMLDEAGTLYSEEDYSSSIRGIKSKTTESFMGGDCLYMYLPDMVMTMHAVRYETEDDFKEGKKQIEDTLKQSLLKKTDVMETTTDGIKGQSYIVDVSDKYVNEYFDEYLEMVGDSLLGYDFGSISEVREQLDKEEQKEFDEQMDQFSIYKFVMVIFGTQDEMQDELTEFSFPSDKSYTDHVCVLATIYLPGREVDLISTMALNANYDAVSGKEIDIDKFKKSVDEELVDTYLDEKASDDQKYRRELEEKLYIKLYMMENHKLDIDSSEYLKTDEEKRLWYIRNFNWDTSTGTVIDLSDYRGSSEIYCAVECNYNSDTSEYFESDLDKALYLADRDYKLGLGDSFGGTDDKRLWFMENYSYDMKAGKPIDRGIVVMFNAYRDAYEEEAQRWYGGEVSDMQFAYIDGDDLPELFVWYPFGGGAYNDSLWIFHYDGNEMYRLRLSDFAGKKREDNAINFEAYSGSFVVRDLWRDGESGELLAYLTNEYEINDSGVERKNTFEQHFGHLGFAKINEDFVSYEQCDAKVKEVIKGREWYMDHDSSTGKKDILSAYDVLRTTIYETYEYCIYEYELKDGILTVKADDGAKVSSSFGSKQPFEFSYPVADDCVWQGGGHGYGPDAQDGSWDVSPEDIESEINQVRELYDTEPDWIESPLGIQFRIMDDEVIAVYTSGA